MTDVDVKDSEGSGESGSSEVAVIQELLEECGVEEYDPRVVGMLMDAQFALTSKILEVAHGIAKHSNKSLLEVSDVQAATDVLGILKQTAPNREKILQLAADKNNQPLPTIRHNYGLKLPNDRFCQLQQNFAMKTMEYEGMSTHVTEQQMNPMLIDQKMNMIRPEHVQNILKRRAPEDDFDN